MQLTLDSAPNYIPSRFPGKEFSGKISLSFLQSLLAKLSYLSALWVLPARASDTPLSLGKTPKEAAGEQSRS